MTRTRDHRTPGAPRRRLIVMLDWENFPGIRPSSQALPLPQIMSFLDAEFEVSARLAYAHRATLSAEWQVRLEAAGFEIRLLDGLVDANDKKNSLDLCLAMDAVRLAYTESSLDAFALLVAGDKDFAVVAAFVRHRLEQQVLAFGSLYCPNPSLASQVDRYFLLEQRDDWPRQLREGTGRYIPRRISESVRRAAEKQRPFIVAGLAELGTDTPQRVGLLVPAVRRRHPDFRHDSGGLRLSTLLEALGCQLDDARQHVLHWPDDLVAAALARAGTTWVLRDHELEHFADRGRLERLMTAIERGFALLGLEARYPLPLSVLHGAMRRDDPNFKRLLSKRLRLWHALEDIGFELNDDHTEILRPVSDAARRIVHRARLARQLDLFGTAGAEPAGPREPVFSMSERSLARAEEALAERVRQRQLALGPLFDGLAGPLQQALPFDPDKSGNEEPRP